MGEGEERSGVGWGVMWGGRLIFMGHDAIRGEVSKERGSFKKKIP